MIIQPAFYLIAACLPSLRPLLVEVLHRIRDRVSLVKPASEFLGPGLSEPPASGMHNFNRGMARVLGERERFIYRQCGPGAAGAAEHCSKPSISISPYSVSIRRSEPNVFAHVSFKHLPLVC